MDLLKNLCEAPGVPGYEDKVREVVQDALDGVADELRTDKLGNVIAHREGEGPIVAVAAHMDEIGFMVSFIDEDTGFLRIHPLGGFDPKTLVAQRVVVHAESEDLIGCIGSKPVHVLSDEERKKPVKLKELFVDVGLSKEAVLEKVSVGDQVTLKQEFLSYGDMFSGKSLDDRLGIYIGIEAMKRTQRQGCDLFFVGTSQEEVGLRGARVAGHAIRPDIAIALDVTVAADMPGVSGYEHVTRCGDGVAIKLTDSASISHPGLVQAARRLAQDRDIAYQMEILPRGGTDAGAMQLARDGVAVLTLSVPTRYVHSVVESAHRDDVEAAVQLLSALLETAGTIDLEL